MDSEELITEISELLLRLDESQLYYICCYIKAYIFNLDPISAGDIPA